LRIDSRDVPSLNRLAMALIHLGKAREALLISRQAMDLDPENAETYGIRSEAWRALGRPSEELIDLANAAQHDPQRFQSAYQDALDQYGRQ
jgi:tetratricopeptide (TPR) repeat protein